MFKLDKERLYLLRARNCLTVGELAEKASVSRRELTADKAIGAVPAGKIAAALGVDVEEIIVKEE